MSITVHATGMKTCRHHCDHSDGRVSIAFEDAKGGIVYMDMHPDRATRIVEAFNKPILERDEDGVVFIAEGV